MIPVDEQDVRDVGLLVRSHHPLLLINEHEGARVEALLSAVARELDMPLLQWRAHSGLQRSGTEDGPVYKTESPGAALAHLCSADGETIAYLRGFDRYMDEADVHSRFVQLHEQLMKHRGAVVLSGAPEDIPSALSRLLTVVNLRVPSADAYHQYLAAVLAEVKQRMPVTVQLSSQEVAKMIEHLRGMPFHEVRKVITQAIVEDGKLDASDIEAILDAKRRVIQRAGTLEYIPVDPAVSSIAGLSRLKRWLEKRRTAFVEPARARKVGLPPPRGLLLTGVQGCGKSLAARAISSTFQLPLVRLDPGSLYRKFFGESEANLRKALKTAEAVSPCILWIDEIEKAFGQGGDSDGGTSKRIFGTFLTWLQEKQETVFVFATANDISQLPPELLRKGRFDEIFFVDLPGHEVRENIFALHLARRQNDPSAFDIPALASASVGFSGAEIEQVIVSGLYSALAVEESLSTPILMAEIEETQPLSVTMQEKVDALRSWAQSRAVSVD